MQRALAITAIVPAAATIYFAMFWPWFAFWRRHRALTYALMLGTIATCAIVVVVLRGPILDVRVGVGGDVPGVAAAIGWLLAAIAVGFGTVADRQLGIHVRSFAPFFDDDERIRLRTTGAYGVVRHPIYAAGIWYQLGVFVATGYVAVAAAGVVLTLGALWFTRQEERRLIERLDDPAAYASYRARVPALFPAFRRRS